MLRYLLVGTIATAVALFVWQSVSNTVIPWHSAPMHPMTAAQVQAVHGAVPEKGLYGANEGILVVMNAAPDMRDLTKAMGAPLARQIVIDLFVALVLAFAVLRLPRTRALATGGTLALVALAISGFLELSNWNWYGYPFAFELSNVADATVQAFLAGWILAWAHGRFTAAASPAAEPVAAR